MSDTLILNADAQPISVIPLSSENWHEAIELMWVERAEVLHEYEDWEVHSPSLTVKVPSVILLRDYVKVARNIKYCRENILLRDDFKCQYCGIDCRDNQSELTLDHVIPRFHGGKTSFTNIVAACHSCNLEKAHYMKMKPNTTPRRPTYWELANKIMQYPLVVPDESWKDYVGWDPSLIVVRQRGR